MSQPKVEHVSHARHVSLLASDTRKRERKASEPREFRHGLHVRDVSKKGYSK